jgi:hypothetical protein
MIYHPSNQNLTLHFEHDYLGLQIQIEKGPFIREYLYRLYQTLSRATDQYREVFAFRFDLRIPLGYSQQGFSYQNEIIDRFIESFKAKIKHNRQMAFRENRYAHDSIVRYAWAREVGQHGRPHYHLAILLNKDAFCALGRFSPGRENMFNRLHEAWASALNLPLDAVRGTVEIPENPCYNLRGDDNASVADFFFRASYLCKAATKAFGHGGHGFGASRT